MDNASAGSGSEPLDVLVIGAGLAMGWHLARRGLRFRIVDAGSEVGQTWRRRWDSLKLFTAAQYAGLPGMVFPAPRHVMVAYTLRRTGHVETIRLISARQASRRERTSYLARV